MDTIEIVAIALGSLLALALVAWLWTGRGRRTARREAAALRTQLATTSSAATSLRLGEQEAAWAARASAARLETTTVRLVKSEHEVARLGNDLEEIKARLAESARDLAATRGDLTISQETVTRLQQDLGEAIRGADQARARLEALQGLEQRLATVSRERDLLSASAHRGEQLESELGALGKVHRELEAAQQEITSLRAQLRGTSRETTHEHERISGLEQANADLMQRLEAVTTARIAEQAALAERSAEVDRLRAELARAGAGAAAADGSEALALRQRIAELEAAIATERRGGSSADDYAVWERELRSRIAAAVDDATRRLQVEVEHLRTVTTEKERTIQRLISSGPAPTQREIGATKAPVITDIKGIGEKIATILASHGVTTVAQVAAFTDADIDRVAGDMPVYPGRVRDDDWVGQAKALLS